MNLEDFATDLVASNRFVKAAFGGFAGGGKSRTSAEFVIGSYHDFGYTKPVLIIDNEQGSRFLIPQFTKAKIKTSLKQTTSLADVLTAIDLVNEGQIDYLFIDSMTKVWYRYVREYLANARKTFMGLDDWGKVLPKWQETFSDVFVAAQGSIVFTGRGGFSYEKEEDTKDESGRVTKKGQYVKSGVKMKMSGETPFEPDLNVWMEQQQEIGPEGLEIWREAQIMKDRTGLIDGKTFKNPTYESFRPFIGYLMDVPTGSVAGETSGRNLAPSENFDSFDRRQKIEIALDEIKEEMLKHHGHGMDAGTKAAKSATLETITKCVFEGGTRSWERLASFRIDDILKVRNELWKLTRGHGYGEQPTPPKDVLVPVAPPEDTKTEAAA
jgi:hypothetical protein